MYIIHKMKKQLGLLVILLLSRSSLQQSCSSKLMKNTCSNTENTNLQYTVQCISEDNVTITWDFRDHDYHLNMEYECYKSGNNTGVQTVQMDNRNSYGNAMQHLTEPNDYCQFSGCYQVLESLCWVPVTATNISCNKESASVISATTLMRMTESTSQPLTSTSAASTSLPKTTSSTITSATLNLLSTPSSVNISEMQPMKDNSLTTFIPSDITTIAVISAVLAFIGSMILFSIIVLIYVLRSRSKWRQTFSESNLDHMKNSESIVTIYANLDLTWHNVTSNSPGASEEQCEVFVIDDTSNSLDIKEQREVFVIDSTSISSDRELQEEETNSFDISPSPSKANGSNKNSVELCGQSICSNNLEHNCSDDDDIDVLELDVIRGNDDARDIPPQMYITDNNGYIPN